MPEAKTPAKNPKPISEATKKHVPVSYLKNKGDIRRAWRAAFPIPVVIGTASTKQYFEPPSPSVLEAVFPTGEAKAGHSGK